MPIRIIRTWHAGRLLQQQFTYRLLEEDDNYSLEVKFDYQNDHCYSVAIGHRLANRIADQWAQLDRLWIAAEEEAYIEDEMRNRVVDIEERKRA